MMKSFFKKLAFVMALAMVVTLAAPAAQKAVAADEKKPLAVTYQNENHYSVTEVNLAKVGDTEDLKFLWAPSNWKELGVKWTSSNENIVTVDSAGVITAVAEGTANVSVAVGTETATIAVNVGELPTYPCTIGFTAEDPSYTEYELKVDGTVDFAFFGIKDYARDILASGFARYECKWASDDTSVATVDDKGLVTAVAPGTAKITLIIMNQRTIETYTAQAVKVTVEAKAAPVVENDFAIINAKGKNYNLTENEVKLVFNQDVTLDKNTNVEVYHVFVADDDSNADGKIDDEGTELEYRYEVVYVDKVTKGADAKTWTIKTYEEFEDGEKYEIRINNKMEHQFTASVGKIADIDLTEKQTAKLAKDELALIPAKVTATLYDKNGVELTDYAVNGIKNNEYFNLTYSLTDENNENYTMISTVDPAEVEFYAQTVATVVASWDDGTLESPVTDELSIAPGDQNSYFIKRVVEWTFVKEDTAVDWSKPLHQVPAGEEDYVIATLMEDSRGHYLTTHQASSTSAIAGNAKKYNDIEVPYWTEDTNGDFWINGYYVKYRAYYEDVMVINEGGEVGTYTEVKGNARYGLHLYDQKLDGDQFVRTIYSQNVTICHPMEMVDFTVTNSKKQIMKNTESDEGIENAYHSEFSKGKLTIELKDIHASLGMKVTDDDIKAATFEFTLTSEKDNAELEAVIQSYVDELNSNKAEKREVEYTADQLKVATKNTIRFTLKETVTGKSKSVVITMVESKLDENGSALVATVNEFDDEVRTQVNPFEKFKLNGSLNTNYVKMDNDKELVATNPVLSLLQVDTKGYDIGYDSNLYISTSTKTTGTLDVKYVINANGDLVAADELEAGDRILFVKAPNGKAFVPDIVFANPDYDAKEGDFAAPASTTALGVDVDADWKTAYSASGDSLAVAGYNFNLVEVAANADPALDKELVFAQAGKYVVTIRTVEEVKDGVIDFTENTVLTQNTTFTVTDNRNYYKFVDRNFINVTEYALTDCVNGIVDDKVQTRGVDNDEDMRALIVKAFKFDNDKLTADDILYYTYTVAPTNNQVIINKVVFKYQLDTGWYRSEVVVNKHLTFVAE